MRYVILHTPRTGENNAKDWDRAVRRVLQFIGVREDGLPAMRPTLQRQYDSRKEEWIERYLRELKERSHAKTSAPA